MSLITLVKESRKYWQNSLASFDEIQKDSLDGFHHVLVHAYDHSVFYHDLYTKAGLKREDLFEIDPNDVPVIAKQDVINHFEQIATIPVYHTADGWKASHGAMVIHSSGSTGTPTPYVYGRGMLTAIEANFVRLVNRGGMNRIMWSDLPIKNIHAASVGSGYASTLLLTSGLKKYHVNCIVVKASDPLEEWVRKIGDFQPQFLSGYPSCVAILLKLQKEGRIHLSPKKIIIGGEPVNRAQMKDLSDAFHADVIDYYGSSESILIGAGSSWYDGMYLFDDLNYVEEDDKHRLILTTLHNPEFPLIRYQMNDIMIHFDKHDHGILPFTHIDGIAGRVEDTLWYDNEEGKQDFLHPLLLDDLYVEGVSAYQYEKTGKDELTVYCLTDRDHQEVTYEVNRQVGRMLADKKMRNVRIVVRFVDHLYRNPRSGKTAMIINHKNEIVLKQNHHNT
ncbi:MAG: AMP-binding protein [Lactimicrobium sp.]|jgi:phenylacetate-CoA ligase|uniref:phenylacetate--CoA ligase family protein n=1 Tax=Lactimicrobium sp. TaxID=2563780 RepID=UPI002F354D2F